MEQAFYKELLDNLYDGVYFVDLNRRITYWNRGAQNISGYGPEDVLGKCCADNLLMHINEAGDQLCTGSCPLAQTLLDGKQREADVYLHHKEGHRIPVCVRITPLHDADGTIAGAVEIFSNGTFRRQLLDELHELRNQSLLDPLTGLGNRRSAGLEFERRLKELRRYSLPFGLLFVDIDNFKRVNDTYGHDRGDQVLVMVAKTLGSALRGVDKVCRWGGEEFLAIVPRVDEAAFRTVAERVRRFVESTAMDASGGVLKITVSVGGALASPSDSLDSLAARADAMMYQSKKSGGNCTSVDCSRPIDAGL
jgi:diguanylate cyclase (GGDEF)-like protein/PAS domain S-box-containing protein